MERKIKQFVMDLCQEHRSITGAEAKRKFDAFLEEKGLSLSGVREFWLHPESTLGEFRKLPAAVQEGLSQAAFHHGQEYYLLTTPLLHAAVFKNPLFLLGNRIVRQGWKSMPEGEEAGWLIQAGRLPMRALRYSARALLEKLRFTRLHSGPPLLALWRYAGVDVPNLIHRYIEDIPIDPSLGPVVETAGGKSEVCALLGIDLLFSDGKAFFVEGNVNAGFHEDRLEIFPSGDPVCLNLVRYAKASGYAEIRFNPANMYGYLFPEQLEDSWRRYAGRVGIGVRIIDDPINGSPYKRPRGILIDPDESGILHVNGRYVEAPLGRMVATKGMMEEIVRNFSKESPTRVVFSPQEISSNAELPPVSRYGRFPNVIVKNIHEDRARGIHLLNVDRIPPEMKTPFFKIYEYVVPDRVVEGTEHSLKEFVFVFRAYLLVTSDGPVYLGARKDISRIPIPEGLVKGPVDEALAFIANATINANSIEPSSEEDLACRDAVLQVGQAVHHFLERKHGSNLRS